MTLSKEQQQFTDLAVSGQNTIASATAGAGKTFTLAAAANSMITAKPNIKGVALTFSKPLADELQRKLPSAITGKTIHSLCYATVQKALKSFGGNRLNVDERKYRKLLQNKDIWNDESDGYMEIIEDLQKLPFGVEEFSKFVDVSYPEETKRVILDILNQGYTQFQEEGTITYNDMVWYPVLKDYSKHAWKNQVVFLDETQDTSALYLKAIQMHSNPNSLFLAVGDQQQTVHAWNGIPLDRFSQIQNELNATNVRFNRTYRLPQEHVDLLYQLNLTDDIVTENKISGNINNIKLDNVYNTAVPGDLILSRFHAGKKSNDVSLVEVGLGLLRQGKPIRYVRFDPVKYIEMFVKFVNRTKITNLTIGLVKWEEKLTEIARNTCAKKGNDLNYEDLRNKMELVDQKVETVQLHLNLYQGNDGNSFIAFVKQLYDRNRSDNAIILSSAHAAKGLESNNVYILNPHQFMSFRREPTIEEYVSEANVLFVALSRSKSNLNFIGEQPMAVKEQYLSYYF